MEPQFANLIDGKVVPCDIKDYIAKTEKNVQSRQIGRYETDTHMVSTVFLGINHAWTRDARPIWFETMIFAKENDLLDQYCQRYTTLKEAQIGHEATIALLKAEVAKRR